MSADPVTLALLTGYAALLGWCAVSQLRIERKVDRLMTLLLGVEGRGGILQRMETIERAIETREERRARA